MAHILSYEKLTDRDPSAEIQQAAQAAPATVGATAPGGWLDGYGGGWQ